jgi:hypothetical protein
METETMIRKELGEDVDVADIDLELAASIRTNAIVVIDDVPGRTSREQLDDMLRHADDAIFAAGAAPTLGGPDRRVRRRRNPSFHASGRGASVRAVLPLIECCGHSAIATDSTPPLVVITRA